MKRSIRRVPAAAVLLAGSLVATPLATADPAPNWSGMYKVTLLVNGVSLVKTIEVLEDRWMEER